MSWKYKRLIYIYIQKSSDYVMKLQNDHRFQRDRPIFHYRTSVFLFKIRLMPT